MKTISTKLADVQRDWYVVDLEGQVLGRAASQIASVLRGKNKPTFTPHVDTGDFVVAINAGKIRLTGNKLSTKKYYHHTGYVGGIKEITAGELLETKPEQVITMAVKRMLPKNPLGVSMLRKFKVYSGSEHPHSAQAPKALELNS